MGRDRGTAGGRRGGRPHRILARAAVVGLGGRGRGGGGAHFVAPAVPAEAGAGAGRGARARGEASPPPAARPLLSGRGLTRLGTGGSVLAADRAGAPDPALDPGR